METSTKDALQVLVNEKAVDVERQILTLILIHQADKKRVLLGMKKRGFGFGKWNGFGGKVERGETFEEAAERELMEEAGVRCTDMERAGILWFGLEDAEGVPYRMQVVVFRGSVLIGEPVESEEMCPQWFAEEDIPYGTMWADNKEWFPYALGKRPFVGSYVLNSDHETIKFSTLHEVDGLPGMDTNPNVRAHVGDSVDELSAGIQRMAEKI